MSTDHFNHMAIALEIESQSIHPIHKVGAMVYGKDSYGVPYSIAHANYWPPILAEKIGREEKLGNASTTVHAEVAAICDAPSTEGATIYVTDLPCPNCAKAIVEARIHNVFIDSHTHNTPLGLKIKPFFDDISMTLFRAANIGVFEINAKEKTIIESNISKESSLSPIQRPVSHVPLESAQINTAHFQVLVAEKSVQYPFAACYARGALGQYVFVCASVHRSIGLTAEQEKQIFESQKKYEPTLQPINRLLLACARYGLKIDPNFLYSSQVPTSREFVNMIGAGYLSLKIGDISASRDEYGLIALERLLAHKILHLQS